MELSDNNLVSKLVYLVASWNKKSLVAISA